jgi:hypothetical protein
VSILALSCHNDDLCATYLPVGDTGLQVREDKDQPGFAYGAISVLDEPSPTMIVGDPSNQISIAVTPGEGGGGEEEASGDQKSMGPPPFLSIPDLLQQSRDRPNINTA